MLKIFKYFVPTFLVLLFIFLRFNNIDNSFFFYNDMGRDMSVLSQWELTKKPPLLGPQTSALPFNQSAIYFYILYPGYLLSHGNPISALYTLGFTYIFAFILGLYLLRKDKILTKVILVSFFLISIHPQYINQFRFVWNPSFVTPFIISTLISFYLLIEKFSKPKICIFSLSIAMAISLSYSVAPLLFAIFIYWLIFNRQKFFSFLTTLFASFFIINLPTIFFELRHHFLLSTSLFTKQSPTQNFISLPEKIYSLSSYVFMTPNQTLNIALLTAFIVLSIYLIVKNIKYPKTIQFISSLLFLLLTILTFITPVTVQAHYIFSFTSLIFIIISSLSIPILSLILLFSLSYLSSTQLNYYFNKAPRTYNEMSLCFKRYCQSHQDSTFVTVQSNYHPFHNGPEHRYLLQKSGCNIKSIETENGQAKYMTLVLDNGNFDNKTNFYELEQFGKYKDLETFDCLPNFKIKVLEKI